MSEEYRDVRGLMGTYIVKPNRARDTQWRRLPLCTKCLTSQRVSEEERCAIRSCAQEMSPAEIDYGGVKEREEGNFLPSASKGFR